MTSVCIRKCEVSIKFQTVQMVRIRLGILTTIISEKIHFHTSTEAFIIHVYDLSQENDDSSLPIRL